MGMMVRSTGREMGDCTSPYEVIMDREYAVREFVDEVVANHKKHYGTFYVNNRPSFDGDAKVTEYYHGALKGEYNHAYDDAKILKAKMHGGYFLFDYFLCIDREVVKDPIEWPEPKERNQKKVIPGAYPW